MNAAFMSSELHERGIHAVSRGVGGPGARWLRDWRDGRWCRAGDTRTGSTRAGDAGLPPGRGTDVVAGLVAIPAVSRETAGER
jgi:hypothetical protein